MHKFEAWTILENAGYIVSESRGGNLLVADAEQFKAGLKNILRLLFPWHVIMVYRNGRVMHSDIEPLMRLCPKNGILFFSEPDSLGAGTNILFTNGMVVARQVDARLAPKIVMLLNREYGDSQVRTHKSDLK